MEEIQQRLARAARSGAAYREGAVSVSFDRLHNAAFACDPMRPVFQACAQAARHVGIQASGPVAGFQASCDARIFARFFPEADIVTFGPGLLEHAHGEAEQAPVAQIAEASAAIAAMALAIGSLAGR
jgi:acetylornithine deacetylase/succinyl-diaminopimelate desuccinylase-like protein